MGGVGWGGEMFFNGALNTYDITINQGRTLINVIVCVCVCVWVGGGGGVTVTNKEV